MLRVSEKSDQKFTQAFLAITVARFLLYLAIIITYSFLLRTDAVRFIISFFVFYLVFTVFEISYLYRDIHPRK
jgi:phosphotransferase system  glucose/maltose/N-acetylglucosamine-specific IIC component